MDEIRELVRNGISVDAVWTPFPTLDGSIATLNYGHRTLCDEEDLNYEVSEHGEPSICFYAGFDHHIGAVVRHIYVK